MTHSRNLGLCAAVACALMMASAGGASAAEPALYECAKVKKSKVTRKFEGKYTEKHCSTLATQEQLEEGTANKFEVQEGVGKGKPFKGKDGGGNIEVPGIGGVSCTKSSDTGRFTSPQEGTGIRIVFTGCEVSRIKCENTATEGEIVTNPLRATIGYVSAAKHEAGIDLSPETGEAIAPTVNCQDLVLNILGSVVGRISPVNVFTKEMKFDFGQTEGRQEIGELEGFPKGTLFVCSEGESCEAPPSALEMEITNKGEYLLLKA
jgi:hypothetical protein